MRITLILVTMLLSVSLYSQSLPLDSLNKVNFNGVVEVDSTSKDELYTRARLFFTEFFNSGESVIDMEDKDAGIVIGKGWSSLYITKYGVTTKTQFWYTIKIYVKDNKYRYIITDMYFKEAPSKYNLTPQKSPVEATVVHGLKKKNGKPNEYAIAWKESLRQKCIDLEILIMDFMLLPANDDW